jgi:hypothetical protein
MVHIHLAGIVGDALASKEDAVIVSGTGGRQDQAGHKKTKPMQAKAIHCASQLGHMIDRTQAPSAETTIPKPIPTKCKPNSGRWPFRINQPSTKPEPINIPAAPHKPPT